MEKSLVYRLLSSVENVIQHSEFGDFYPVRRVLSSEETLTNVRRSLFMLETFIQCGDFYPVKGLLSIVQTFIQSGDFYLVRGLSSIVQTFIQSGDLYLVQRL